MEPPGAASLRLPQPRVRLVQGHRPVVGRLGIELVAPPTAAVPETAARSDNQRRSGPASRQQAATASPPVGSCRPTGSPAVIGTRDIGLASRLMWAEQRIVFRNDTQLESTC